MAKRKTKPAAEPEAPRPRRGPLPKPENAGLVALYVEIRPDLKAKIEDAARANHRTLKGQVVWMLEQALDVS